MLYEGEAYGTFVNVTIDKFIWNPVSKSWSKNNEEPHYGFANELMPFIRNLGGYIIPNNTKKEDLEFCGIQWSLDEGKEVFGGNPEMNTVDENNYYKTHTSMANGEFIWDIWYEKTSGLSHIWSYDVKNEKYYGDKYWERRYIKENNTLGTINNIELNTQMLNNIERVYANISTDVGSYPRIVIGLLPLCPVNESLPSGSGTPLVFVDWLITDGLVLNYLNFTIKLSATLDLDTLNIRVWVWNSTGYEYDWSTPSDASLRTVFNYAENSITFMIPLSYPESIEDLIFGVSYTVKSTPSLPPSGDDDGGGGGAEKPAAISSFDIWIVFGIVAFVSLIAILKRRKLVRVM